MSEENKVDSKAAFISWYIDLHAVSPNARSLLEQIVGRNLLPQHLILRLSKENITEENFWLFAIWVQFLSSPLAVRLRLRLMSYMSF